MNLVSFDIGIKNMAFCVLTPEMVMKKWTIVNLMPQQQQQQQQQEHGKKKCSFCKRNAKFSLQTFFFCQAHTVGRTLPSKEWTLAKKKNLPELRALLDTLGFVDNASANRAVCLERLQEWIAGHVLQTVGPPPKAKSAHDADLIEVGRRLMEELDAVEELAIDVGHVVIENQISPLAARMRTLQGMLTQYFILRHPAARIHYISSSNKLKEFVSSSTSLAIGGNGGSGYHQHKVDSVTHCVRMLEANPTLGYTSGFLRGQKKEDDLADSFLQAMWFLKHSLKKINWSADDLKIKLVEG